MSTFFLQQSVLHGLVIYLGFAIVFRHPAADVREGPAPVNRGCDGPPMAVGGQYLAPKGAALLHNQVAATALAGAPPPRLAHSSPGTRKMTVPPQMAPMSAKT